MVKAFPGQWVLNKIGIRETIDFRLWGDLGLKFKFRSLEKKAVICFTWIRLFPSVSPTSSPEQCFSDLRYIRTAWRACSSTDCGPPPSADSILAGLGCGLRICISNRFSGDADADGLGTTLWELEGEQDWLKCLKLCRDLYQIGYDAKSWVFAQPFPS